MDLLFFTNDKYDLLKLLYDKKIRIKDESYTSLSQQEMADMLHYSKLKTNEIMNELKDLEFVEIYKNTRGKYALTERAIELIRIIENTKV